MHALREDDRRARYNGRVEGQSHRRGGCDVEDGLRMMLFCNGRLCWKKLELHNCREREARDERGWRQAVLKALNDVVQLPISQSLQLVSQRCIEQLAVVTPTLASFRGSSIC